jgi:glycosyltransferase involved in cell wall biosynthesis
MKVLLLNQCFYPDVAATGQYLTDLAVGLSERGHNVTVITGARGYDDPSRRFARRETWRGIEIIRIGSLNPGKETKWRRAVNFASFLLACAFRLLLLQPKCDAVVVLTSPPLISFLGALFVQLKGGKLFYWIMDLNPDEAIAAGWLHSESLVARFLALLLRFSLRSAERVIVLDRFMKQRILDKGIADQRVVVVPPWPLTEDVRYDESGREAFRARHGLVGKYVVMYAGNHSPCHPLETILNSALRLADHDDIVFCFVGGGSEQTNVKKYAADHQLANIRCLPYQPLAELSGTLSAADLHVVVMGASFVGIVHPCKIYNILAVGSPVLCVGPEDSHITDIARGTGGLSGFYFCPPGASETVVRDILAAASQRLTRANQTARVSKQFSRAMLLPSLIAVLESVTSTHAVPDVVYSQPSV